MAPAPTPAPAPAAGRAPAGPPKHGAPAPGSAAKGAAPAAKPWTLRAAEAEARRLGTLLLTDPTAVPHALLALALESREAARDASQALYAAAADLVGAQAAKLDVHKNAVLAQLPPLPPAVAQTVDRVTGAVSATYAAAVAAASRAAGAARDVASGAAAQLLAGARSVGTSTRDARDAVYGSVGGRFESGKELSELFLGNVRTQLGELQGLGVVGNLKHLSASFGYPIQASATPVPAQ